MQNNQKIPEGWNIKKLGNVIDTFSGGTPLAGKSIYYENGKIPFIRSGEIYQNYTELFITEKGLQESSAKMVNKGDLLFALYGANSGEIAISQIEGAINQAILCIRPKEDNVHYLKNSLILLKDRILHKYLQGGQGNLSLEIVKSLKLLFPPLPEQEKIAEILGTWDEAIEKLSGLIEQKKLLKKGLMQKLLTGQTRLPGFSQPWKEVKLGEICKLEATTSKSAFIDENGKYYIIDMGAVSTEGTLISSKRTNTCEDLLKINDIVMPKDDIGGGNIIGKTAIIKQENTYILSDHVFKLNIHDSDSNFISYLINSYGYNKYMRRMSCGSAILGLSKKDVEKCLLNIPSNISEQHAIAEVLSTADDEINLLNQKLEATKEQKKGLMQQLLTGQIRVKVN